MPRQFAPHPEDATRNEDRVSARLKQLHDWDCQRTPKLHPFDFWARLGGRLVGIVEVKHRDMIWGDYPTIHVSLKKVRRCLEEARAVKVPFFFAVLCTSGLFVAQLGFENTASLSVKMGGRTDRGISKDVEQLVDIPLSYFLPS